MKINEYVINTDKLINEKKIAIVSDVHINEFTNEKKLLEILDKLDSIKPTQIVIPGDLYNIDEKTIYRKNLIVYSFLDNLANISDVFYVKGDSELRAMALPYKVKELKNPHFNFLCESATADDDIHASQKIVSFDDINIAAIKLDYDFYNESEVTKVDILTSKYKKYLDKIAKFCNSKNYNVLLCHDPIIIEACRIINSINKFDLVISGHNHGGLIPEKLKPLLVHTNIDINKLYPKYVIGCIKKNNTNFIISEGITKFQGNLGIFNSLEHFHEGKIEVIKVKTK